jgi:hypothetical protein
MNSREVGATMEAAIRAADDGLRLRGKLVDQFTAYRALVRTAAAEAERASNGSWYAAGQLRDLLGEERRR